MLPKISIITVVYNGVSTLEETIHSVINQNFDDFEYIIVDGGSTDGTLDVIKKYQDKITVWVSEPDKGIYDAMNKGIKLAKGEWIYFLNCGDFFCSINVLKHTCLRLKKSNLSVLLGNVLVDSKTSYPILNYNSNEINARKLFKSHFCHQALFVKRKAYNSVRGFNMKYKFFSDFFTIYSIIKAEKGFEIYDIAIARYNLDGISANYQNTIKLYLEAEKLLNELGYPTNKFFYIFNYLRSYLYYFKIKIKRYAACSN